MQNIKRQITVPEGYNHVLMELSTGFGKTYNSLAFIHNQMKCKRPLIVLPKRVLEASWNAELAKWGFVDVKPVYIQYKSFIKPHKWLAYKDTIDCIIMDEVHNLSERALSVIRKHSSYVNSLPVVLLSATVTMLQKREWRKTFTDLHEIQANLSTAIAADILPSPTICYVRCTLNEYQRTIYSSLQNKCLFLKKQIRFNSNKEKAYLHMCKVRNVWLSKQKNYIIKQIHEIYSNPEYKSITFCADIEQCNSIDSSISITSKNANSSKVLEDFNNNKIQNILACNMLNEGVNLTSCRLGIFSYLTISERITSQQLGRLLRHPKPIVYILYYANTRDEEIAKTIYKRFKNVSETRTFAYEKIQKAYDKIKDNKEH